MSSVDRARPGRRSGSVLVCILVAMSVVVAILAAGSLSALRARRQLRSEESLRQAEWLLEAAAQRAAHRSEADASYAGEVWRPELPGHELVQITIEPVAAATSPAGANVVLIRVELEGSSPQPIRLSEHLVVK